MVSVIIKSSIAGADFSFIPGQMVKINEELAVKWVEAGICEYDEIDIILSEKDKAIAEILINAEKEKEIAIAETIKKTEEEKEIAISEAIERLKENHKLEIKKLEDERNAANKKVVSLEKQLVKVKPEANGKVE